MKFEALRPALAYQQPFVANPRPIIKNLVPFDEHRTVRQHRGDGWLKHFCQAFFPQDFDQAGASRLQRLQHVLQNNEVFFLIVEISEGGKHAEHQREGTRAHKIPHILLDPFDFEAGGARILARLVQQVLGSVNSGDRKTSLCQGHAASARAAAEIERRFARGFGECQRLGDLVVRIGDSFRGKHERIQFPPERIVVKPLFLALLTVHGCVEYITKSIGGFCLKMFVLRPRPEFTTMAARPRPGPAKRGNLRGAELPSARECAMKRQKSKGNAELPKCRRPEDVGLSSERLGRIKEAFRTRVESGDIPGAVVLIARHGKLAFFEAFGYRDREKQARMNTDAIFRIASMTKPFTSVALMMLTEEGKVQIAYPVSQFLPEFKNLQVGVEKKGEPGAARLELQPAKREITIHDLLRHTSGLTYGFFGASPVKSAYNDAKMLDPEQTNAEMVTKLSKLPLVYQPGTTWDYSMSTDVLGRVVEVVSGMSFDRFIAERISQPLGLHVTEFSVNQKHANRVAEP